VLGSGEKMTMQVTQDSDNVHLLTNWPQIGRINLLTPTRVSAASKEIKTGEIVPLNLPLNVPAVPAFGREIFKHEIKVLAEGLAYDDKYQLNTQSGTQWDGFRHMAHFPSQKFYNGTTGKDVTGPEADPNKCGIQHWARHGIAGRGVLIDYWSYAKEKGIIYGKIFVRFKNSMLIKPRSL
jgi:hypothetical protein